MREINTVVVTGGAGFIGSAVARQFISETDVTVMNVDAPTYADKKRGLPFFCYHYMAGKA